MVNAKLTNHTIPSQSEGEGDQPSDVFSELNKERPEWSWLQNDEEFDE